MSASASFTICFANKVLIIRPDDSESANSSDEEPKDCTSSGNDDEPFFGRHMFRLLSSESRALEDINCLSDFDSDAADSGKPTTASSEGFHTNEDSDHQLDQFAFEEDSDEVFVDVEDDDDELDYLKKDAKLERALKEDIETESDNDDYVTFEEEDDADDEDEDDDQIDEEPGDHQGDSVSKAAIGAVSSDPVSLLDSPQGRLYLDETLKWLGFKERVKCERVCSSWREAVRKVNSTRQSSLGLFGGNIAKIQNFCPQHAHRVFASDCVELGYFTDLCSILSKVPNLLSLHIRCEGCPVFKREGEPEAVAKLCPKLEHLSFVDDSFGVNIYDEIMKVLTTCSTIRHLQLRFPYKSSSQFTDQLALESLIIKRALYTYNRNLEILSINVPLNQEHCDILSNYCKLRKLSLHGTTIPLLGLTALLEEGDVRGKYLRCLSMVIDSQGQLAMICRNMICLQSFHCVVNNEAKNLNMKCISLIGSLKNLKNLFLSCWTNQVIDDGLVGILMGCSQLTSLTVNANCSDVAIKYMGNFCPFIERLEINNGQANLITDVSVEQSIVHLEFLRFLTLYYCDITDDALQTLFADAKDLEYLSITYSARLTERSLRLLVQFASEKPWERITAVMPRSLTRYKYLVCPLPRNLVLNFHK